MSTFRMPRINNPTGRNTQCYDVHIHDIVLTFSYQTLIAIMSPRVRARLKNSWGPTTGRHFNEAGVANFPIAKDEEFERIVAHELTGIGAEMTRDRFRQTGTPIPRTAA